MHQEPDPPDSKVVEPGAPIRAETKPEHSGESHSSCLRGSKSAEVSSAEVSKWRQHLANGHVPYRRDCKQCVEGAGLAVFHKRIKYPKSYALSVDLFGPVPLAEAGRDEGCVTGKSVLRYGLVGAFRVPRSALREASADAGDGLKDLFANMTPRPPDPNEELADYEPSEGPDDLFPELFRGDLMDDRPIQDNPRTSATVDAVTSESSQGISLLSPDEVPQNDDDLRDLIKQLQTPVEQVVLRYFVPLRTKTGPEVSTALQQMILDINQYFPVRSLHHDPGTEFASTALSRWLAQHGVRVQHSLPTDKKGNGLAERTVGWVKSRIRTLLKSAELPVQWWPLAARWAVAKHNAAILDKPEPPGFGQGVLHRIKRPADGAKQLMERWIEARYAAPHRSIPDGHVLITKAGNLVASRGFKAGVIDPTKIKDLGLPILQEEDNQEEAFNSSGEPLKRLREKTSVRFVECLSFPTSEEVSHGFLMSQTYDSQAIRRVLDAVAQEEDSTGDRRGIVDGRQILGAYCHGGLRGVTNLLKRKPWTTIFLNRALLMRLLAKPATPRPSWSALMLMRAGDVEVHRDWRSEWGTLNYTMHLPGEVQL